MHYSLCIQLGDLFAEREGRAITLRVVPHGLAVADAAALPARLAAANAGAASHVGLV
ncbi:hypothetical protein [Mycobacterium haemophilum]|uniref:hypothetical protein n=1 Tax=Mycobacterium haemophilum TaxID=29311 RepID=UPI000A92739E|nr:hypothetical protein [Mycobacterium haemophilum]MCV7341891.1 hypothetical protein [Mycobacterium haemophilum DSM 44634]